MAKNWLCLDCKTKIWNRYNRCKSCASKGKLNRNYGKGLFRDKNPNWKGGIAKNPYTFKFKSTRHTIHDKYKHCQLCLKNTDLVVHHINHDRSDNGPFNLVTLCRRCNSYEPWRRNSYECILYFKTYEHFIKTLYL